MIQQRINAFSEGHFWFIESLIKCNFKEQTVHNLKSGIDASKGFQRFIDSSSEFGIPEKLWFIFKIGVSDYLINISACLIKFSL